ncbi:MAG: hypothetical protein IJ299_00170 [Oscillospiraceae bacterium]|nr:hypothetical protein [Oscillospiraceae bacterium]
MVTTELWNLHLSQKKYEMKKEEAALMQKVLEYEEKLLSTMTKEQSEIFEEYSQTNADLNGYAIERAFKTGTRFATSYILENLEMK